MPYLPKRLLGYVIRLFFPDFILYTLIALSCLVNATRNSVFTN